MNLETLLRPRTIAVVGASEKEGFGGDTCRNICEAGDPSRVYFINPKRETVFGRPCYPSLSALPGPIDQVIICTPQKTVNSLLREAAAQGATSAVVYASGYKEVGTPEGAQAEEALRALCQELGMSLMGPNCAGFINFAEKIHSFAFISARRERTGAVGLVSQSGQICLSALDTPNMRLSYAISAGNCAVTSMEDYLHFLVDDEKTRVVAMFLEGVSQPEKFIAALKRAALKRKPVVIFKVGRSEKGSATAASHTGSLSGADATFDAVFAKFGVIRVNDFQELLSTSLTLATWKELPRHPGVASMNLSGGETGICADVGHTFGVEYPDFAPHTLHSLREQLPSYATPRNPLDMTASLSYEAEKYAHALQTVMDDPNIGMVVIGYTLLLEISDPCIHYMAKGIEQVVSSGKPLKPIAMLPFAENSRNPEYLDKLDALGVPILPPPVYGLQTIAQIAQYTAYSPAERTLEMALPKQGNHAPGKKRILPEYESMQLLRKAGIAVPQGRIAATAQEAAAIARELGVGNGSKVVLKIASADIPHKTDAGGVRLHLASAEEVTAAFAAIMDSCRAYAPKAALDGVFVQKMLAPGLEVILGVNNDAQFGPQVLCGLGGVFVEIFKDTALYPAPMNKNEALAMIRSLKAYPLFTGYRGKPALDVDALAETIAAVSRLAATLGDSLAELDINPVFVYPEGQGVCAADALAVLYE